MEGAIDGLGAAIGGRATWGFCAANDEFGVGSTLSLVDPAAPADDVPPLVPLPPPDDEPLLLPDDDDGEGVALLDGEGDFDGFFVGDLVGSGVKVTEA
ncbi:hypothetical protein [Actinomadura sp. NTSP31]|uniref:hypothetical protein n=1 Tax=Actinomadura sp. NTSP31 TaxID=1735447 RepID=UPI0035C1707A